MNHQGADHYDQFSSFFTAFLIAEQPSYDRYAATRNCQAYGRWVAAETALARMAERDAVTEGLIIRSKTGNAIQNPLVGAANKAMADMVRYAAEFGLTPSARSRVSAVGQVGDDNAFDAFEREFG